MVLIKGKLIKPNSFCDVQYGTHFLRYTIVQAVLRSEVQMFNNIPDFDSQYCKSDSVADPDPGSGAFLTPGSGMG